MITDLIVKMLTGLAHGILSGLPALSVPSWLNGSDSAFGTIFTDAGSMSVWFPTTLVLAVVVFVLGAYGIGFVIKGVRILASLFTGGGGSAA